MATLTWPGHFEQHLTARWREGGERLSQGALTRHSRSSTGATNRLTCTYRVGLPGFEPGTS
jgi:hypothetical protein